MVTVRYGFHNEVNKKYGVSFKFLKQYLIYLKFYLVI